MKSLWLLPLLLLLCGCGAAARPESGYRTITAGEAKEMMDSGSDCVVLDVRTREEYEQGHIPGALCLPLDSREQNAGELLPDRSRPILVYCRSGRRSANAAEKLAALGYTDVRDFGGILDWPYEVER